MTFVDPALQPPAQQQQQQQPPSAPQTQAPPPTQQQTPAPPQETIQVPVQQETEEERNKRERPRDPETGRFTTEEIERARQQEKDKLYPRITEMEEEIKKLRAEREQREAAERAQREQQEAAARAKQEEEMSVRELLNQREQEWQQRFRQIEQEREKDKAIFERENSFRQVQDYRTDRLTAEADNIMPELRDLVAGDTKEAIDASIENLKERTNRILQQVQGAQQQQRQEMRGASITSPPVGPMEQQTEYETLSPDDIRNMSMAEYSKRRQQLLGAAGQQRRTDRGLMG